MPGLLMDLGKAKMTMPWSCASRAAVTLLWQPSVQDLRGSRTRARGGLDQCPFTKKDNNMKITSHHLPITSLVSRSNLRLIPLLLLPLLFRYCHGMPHVLRFGKNLFTCICNKCLCAFPHELSWARCKYRGRFVPMLPFTGFSVGNKINRATSSLIYVYFYMVAITFYVTIVVGSRRTLRKINWSW